MADPLEQLYMEYRDSVYRFLYRSTMNPHHAEELTQETFIKAFKGIRKFRGESSIKTWLFTIAHNTFLNDVRKKSYQMERHQMELTPDIQNSKDDFRAAENQLDMQTVLSKLEEKERTFIILRDLQDFTYSEIASVLGMTEGQVKIGIYRARKKFAVLYQSQEVGTN